MLYDEGDQLFQSDHDKEAIEAFKRAIAVDPNFADAHFKLALSYAAVERIEESREEFKKAIDAYKKIVEANPDDVEAYFNMGRSYARMNLFESAAGAFRQAARIKKDDADIYYELGIVQIKLAQYNDAISSLNKSLEIDPENYRASEALEDAKAGKQRITSYVKHQEDLDKKEKEKTANANMTAPKPE
jgi:tetratricopeptide (TPR) repeat protein